jgi:hydrogenase maturation protein HypF
MKKMIFATGADIKSRFLLAKGDSLRFGPDIGDLSEAANYELFKKEVRKLIKDKPDAAVCDLHPGYFSTRFAKENYENVLPVQHHHAHIASVMHEHGLKGPVVGLCFDGTGYGTDGNIWGGEFIIAKGSTFERAGHLKYRMMPGGDKCVREPWRMALSVLGKEGACLLKQVPKKDKDLVLAMMEKGINSPFTSSAGRLFDAAAALLGICAYASYEAEGPIKLESISDKSLNESYGFKINREGGCYAVDTDGLFRGIAGDMKRKVRKNIIASKFHNSMAEIIVKMAKKLSKFYSIKDTALSGGVFQNNYLKEKVLAKLSRTDLNVFINDSVPVNDVNIALGQYHVFSSSRKS